ncbi:ferredoxin-NADP reductase [candidate division TA06 bacterium DG_78]|uniref:Ferredoxin-NADP reductase n=1 Tax=candidate division TA06 bacterium DG_78 TaxID=1703772 RepID=A0A0S7YIN0_UNCT6|nr:MAG: ferredoxin-NADP reductase [candidate division TA06 bacterium DG_78]
MYKVLKREQIVPNIHLLVIESEFIYKNAQAGEFVVVRADEQGERIPLNLVDWDEKSVTMLFMEVGTSTRKLATLNSGDEIATLAGPLGKPTEMVKNQRIVCIGGCYGIGALYPVIRAFKENNNYVTTLIEARSSFLLYWQDKLKQYSDELHEVTRDGTKGFRGHINDVLVNHIKKNKVDLVYVQGCTYLTYLSSETTKPFGVKTIVGLNPIMVDATGMCGVCRVIINGETKFGCVDGPEFDGHQVDWNTLLARRRIYLGEERYSLSFYECETYG